MNDDIKNWRIKYHSGAGDFDFTGTRDEALAAADDSIGYTQQSIGLYEVMDDGSEVLSAVRTWYGCEPDEADEENGCVYLGGGYFAPWCDV